MGRDVRALKIVFLFVELKIGEFLNKSVCSFYLVRNCITERGVFSLVQKILFIEYRTCRFCKLINGGWLIDSRYRNQITIFLSN